MNAPSPKPIDPIVKAAVTVAGIGAGFIANKLLERVWGAVFDENAPTEKFAKESAKEAKEEYKEAKKDGASKAELSSISSEVDLQPVWKLLLWAAVSGVVVQGLRLMAERGAARGAERLIARRPDPNRG